MRAALGIALTAMVLSACASRPPTDRLGVQVWLADDSADLRRVSFSPNGHLAALEVRMADDRIIRVVNINSPDHTTEFAAGARCERPTWASDSQNVLTSCGDGAARSAVRWKLPTTDAQDILPTSRFDFADIIWPIELADGRLAGSSRFDAADGDPNIAIVERDGSMTTIPHPTRDLWLSQGGRADAAAFFSRAATEGESDDIYVLSLEDGSIRRLTDHPANDFVPAISPDGAWVTFASNRDPSGPKIFVMPFDGGEPRQLTFGPWRDTEPAWTADGASIAFSRKSMESEFARDQIWISSFDPEDYS